MADGHETPDGTDDADLRELRMIAERFPADEAVEWETPPLDLWDRIAAEVGSSGPADLDTVPEPAVGAGDRPPDVDAAGVTSLDEARRRRWPRSVAPWLAGAAAVLVAVVIGAVALVGRSDGPEVVASTSLDRLAGAGSGRVELLDDGGELRLRVETADLDPDDGFLELWVIDADVTKLVSLGPLRPDETYDLPPGLDPHDFPVVDISVEPLDGDPTHSGDSLLRGQLDI